MKKLIVIVLMSLSIVSCNFIENKKDKDHIFHNVLFYRIIFITKFTHMCILYCNIKK